MLAALQGTERADLGIWISFCSEGVHFVHSSDADILFAIARCNTNDDDGHVGICDLSENPCVGNLVLILDRTTSTDERADASERCVG